MASKAAAAKSKCLICKKNKPYSRGACQSCLSDVRELVRIGQTTDDDLVAKKLLLPKQRVGPKRVLSPLLQRLGKRAS